MASSLTKAPAGPAAEKTFLGHPRGLANLFMTEMWERYSFYGMRALLVLYLATEVADGGLGLKDATAVAIYSVYNAMVYLLALPGGWLGDRVWGARKATAIAGVVIMSGHFMLAVPVKAAFFIGLALIAIGSGVLKANISTMVSQLYPDKNDPRRDGGFTIFYMGINLGAFLAPLTIGAVGQKVNWHLGFGMAGVGMAIGLLCYFLGYRHLAEESARIPDPLPRADRSALLRKGLIWLGIAAAFYAVVGLAGVFHEDWIIVPLALLGISLPVWYVLRIRRDPDLTEVERGRMSGYIWFLAASAVFWIIYDQGGSVLALFAKNDTQSTLFGFDFPESWFQSLNPLFVMAFAPVFAMLWVALFKRAKEPGTLSKFAMALVLIGTSFGVMMIAQGLASGDARVSPMWLVSVYFLQTMGELCLSPVGLSLTSKLAPEKYSSQMMGVWFLAISVGGSVTALLQTFGAATDSEAWFAIQGALAVLTGVGIYLSRRKVQKLLGGVH